MRILDEGLDAAVRLSHRYLPDRQLPDKAVSVLDTACARLALGQNSTPPAQSKTRRARSTISRCRSACSTREAARRAPTTASGWRRSQNEARKTEAALGELQRALGEGTRAGDADPRDPRASSKPAALRSSAAAAGAARRRHAAGDRLDALRANWRSSTPSSTRCRARRR